MIVPSTNKKPLFNPGRVVGTMAAVMTLAASEQLPDEFVERHKCGDWGTIEVTQTELNDFSAKVQSGKIVSQYVTTKGAMLYIVTNATHTETTIMLKFEYE